MKMDVQKYTNSNFVQRALADLKVVAGGADMDNDIIQKGHQHVILFFLDCYAISVSLQ